MAKNNSIQFNKPRQQNVQKHKARCISQLLTLGEKTTRAYSIAPRGRLKMREWKMRYGKKCKGGKCRSRLFVWKA